MANRVTDYLHAYLYDEGEGAEGGNNVISLVYKYLCVIGMVKEWEEYGKLPGESCTFVFDNCACQNKNRIMLRFPMQTIEMVIIRK